MWGWYSSYIENCKGHRIRILIQLHWLFIWNLLFWLSPNGTPRDKYRWELIEFVYLFSFQLHFLHLNPFLSLSVLQLSHIPSAMNERNIREGVLSFTDLREQHSLYGQFLPRICLNLDIVQWDARLLAHVTSSHYFILIIPLSKWYPVHSADCCLGHSTSLWPFQSAR
jgi:hypothetical protein